MAKVRYDLTVERLRARSGYYEAAALSQDKLVVGNKYDVTDDFGTTHYGMTYMGKAGTHDFTDDGGRSVIGIMSRDIAAKVTRPTLAETRIKSRGLSNG